MRNGRCVKGAGMRDGGMEGMRARGFDQRRC
jgi:hypothetical protein